MDNPSAPQLNNLTPTPKTQPKLLRYLLLVFLLLLVALGGFILGKYFTETKEEPIDTTAPILKKPVSLPTTDPTAGWKIYINEKYRYEFKYPANIFISEKRYGDSHISLYNNKFNENYHPELNTKDILLNVFYSVTVANYPPVLEYNKKIIRQTNGEKINENATKLYNIENNGIKGAVYYQGISSESTGSEIVSYIAIWEKLGYQVEFSTKNEKVLKEHKALFDQILATFRFLDENQSLTPTVGTENWKSYTNSVYKYQFKCPPSSIHNIEVTNGDGDKIPLYQEICYEGENQVRIMTFKHSMPQQEEITNVFQEEFIMTTNGETTYLRGFDKNYFDQILSTFKILE